VRRAFVLAGGALLLLCAVGAPRFAHGQILSEETIKTYQDMDVRTLLKKAKAGDPVAQYIMGFRAARDQDYAQAAEWYRKAADQGLPLAQNELSFMYSLGRGVPKDEKQARAWMQKAADQGFAVSEGNLANFLESGVGGPQDYEQARKLYQRAYDHGDYGRAFDLGRLSANGQGGPQDNKQARYWYQKAADHGEPIAENALGFYYEKGWGGPRDLEQARILYQKAADQGLEDAKKALARLGGPQSPSCDANWSPRFNSIPGGNDPAGMRAQIQQKLDGIVAQYGGFEGAIREIENENASNSGNDTLSAEQREALDVMDQGLIDILKCRQSIQQSQMAASSAQVTVAQTMQAPASGTPSTTPSTPQAPTPVDVRYFPNSDSRPLTDAEMRSLQNSLRWDPESAPLTQGGTARSNLVDDKGRTLGSVLVRWERRAPGATQATFTVQIQNGTSCFFHSSAELDDAQGFIVIGGPVWAGWLTLSQPTAGETKQAQGRAALSGNVQSLSLKPATAYSTLSGCMTPKNQ